MGIQLVAAEIMCRAKGKRNFIEISISRIDVMNFIKQKIVGKIMENSWKFCGNFAENYVNFFF